MFFFSFFLFLGVETRKSTITSSISPPEILNLLDHFNELKKLLENDKNSSSRSVLSGRPFVKMESAISQISRKTTDLGHLSVKGKNFCKNMIEFTNFEPFFSNYFIKFAQILIISDNFYRFSDFLAQISSKFLTQFERFLLICFRESRRISKQIHAHERLGGAISVCLGRFIHAYELDSLQSRNSRF